MVEVANLLIACSIFGVILWLSFFRKRPRSARNPAPDDPAQPYSVFTAEYDVEALASEASAALKRLPPNRLIYSRSISNQTWPSRLASAEEACAATDTSPLQRWLGANPNEIAIALLVDLSGSMGDAIVPLAGELRKCCDLLTRSGIPVALLGFTTVGWRGGQSRQKWIANGSPTKPGRLCDLLHVTFKQFDEQLGDDDWRAMLHPGLLSENIDGEALEWAATMLKSRPEPKKFLVALSDGAPVDDSTLIENGAGFLERHIRSVIATLERDRALKLGAIGIGFDADRYYAKSTQLGEPGTLSESLAALLTSLSE